MRAIAAPKSTFAGGATRAGLFDDLQPQQRCAIDGRQGAVAEWLQIHAGGLAQVPIDQMQSARDDLEEVSKVVGDAGGYGAQPRQPHEFIVWRGPRAIQPVSITRVPARPRDPFTADTD